VAGQSDVVWQSMPQLPPQRDPYTGEAPGEPGAISPSSGSTYHMEHGAPDTSGVGYQPREGAGPDTSGVGYNGSGMASGGSGGNPQ